MSETQIISADKLLQKLEADTTNNKLRLAGQVLLNAINDWPTPDLSEPKELLEELNKYITLPFTYEKVAQYYNTLEPATTAWKLESISQLLEIFDYDKAKSLETIIIDISKHYNT